MNAIVARAVPYGESDMIVTLVSVEEGRLTATARGCLKKGAKLRYAAEPFNFGEYVLAGKNGRYVVAECSQIDSFSPITADIERYYAGAFILDALSKLSEEPSGEIFAAALRALKELAYSSRDENDVTRDFLLSTLAASGSGLNFKACSACGCILDGHAYFSDADGIVCARHAPIGAVAIDKISRAYLAGEGEDTPRTLKLKANILLCDFVYMMIGVRISSRYLTEQL